MCWRILQQARTAESARIPDWARPVDVSDTGKDYVIKTQMPEVKKEDAILPQPGINRPDGWLMGH